MIIVTCDKCDKSMPLFVLPFTHIDITIICKCGNEIKVKRDNNEQ